MFWKSQIWIWRDINNTLISINNRLRLCDAIYVHGQCRGWDLFDKYNKFWRAS
jgi:hypothetical protein